jgi:uncharacterized membrane protein
MTSGASCKLERAVAATLYWGTWVASSVVGVGLLLAMLDSGAAVREMAVQCDMRIASGGIALFILLPVIRVIVMLLAFLRDRDYRSSLIAAFVLAITLLGLLVGSRLREVSWSPPTSPHIEMPGGNFHD